MASQPLIGITTSEVGVEAARARAEQRGLADRVTFELRDGLKFSDGAAVTASKARLAALDSEIAELITRWEALETIASET